MAEQPSDLNLPISIVSRIISDAIPANTNVSVETRKAIAKAASVFVLYATASAAGQATKRNRKTTHAVDVLEGIEEMEFAQFLPALQKSLEIFRQNQKPKKQGKKKAEADMEEGEDDNGEPSEEPAPDKTKKNAFPDVVTVSDDTD